MPYSKRHEGATLRFPARVYFKGPKGKHPQLRVVPSQREALKIPGFYDTVWQSAGYPTTLQVKCLPDGTVITTYPCTQPRLRARRARLQVISRPGAETTVQFVEPANPIERLKEVLGIGTPKYRVVQREALTKFVRSQAKRVTTSLS